MTVLQWSLLVLGVGVALLLVASTVRERRAAEKAETPRKVPRVRVGSDLEAEAVSDPKARKAPADFDELGVGRARRSVGTAAEAPAVRRPPAVTPVQAEGAEMPDRVIALYIAEHEGTAILGEKIHAALQDQGLVYGARNIYHRLAEGRTLFSVASLVTPGHLNPDHAQSFSTPGLSVFMVLPGPSDPLAAYEQMLASSRVLARLLRAELFDSQTRKVLSPEREREVRNEIAQWSAARGKRRAAV